MKFDDFKTLFVKENRKLKVFMLLVLILNGTSFLFVLGQRKYFIHRSGEIFSERPLVESICKESFESIITGENDTNLITKGILTLLKDSAFVIDKYKFLLIKSMDQDRCKIVLESDKKLRAFLITLRPHKNYPFYYKLNQVDETKI